MPRTNSQDWSEGDSVSGLRLQDVNLDIDDLYELGSDRLRIVRAVSGIAAKIDIGAGAYRVGDTHGTYAGATDISVTLSATNYVMIDAAGTIGISTVAWDSAKTRLGVVVCDGSGITSITLWRVDAVGGLLGGSTKVNSQSLSGTLTMTSADKKYQLLDPNGANRTVTLPSSSLTEGDSFFIKNTGSAGYVLNVKQSSTLIKQLRQGDSALFVCDGTNWYVLLFRVPPPEMFGDGSGGAASYTSGTTNLDNTKIWQWESLSISSGATLGVSTANVPLIGRIRGDVSIAGTLTVASKGGAGSSNTNNLGASGGGGTTGGVWQNSPFNLATGAGGGGGGGRDGTGNNNVDGASGGGGASMFTDGSAGTGAAGGGSAGAKMTAANIAYLFGLGFWVSCGGGGGGGGSPGGSGTGGSSGDGGIGGGAVLFFIYGDLTIETTASLICTGANGTSGSGNPGGWSDGWGGGGGGGGGTIIFVVYGTVTINGTPTYSKNGGTAGSSEDGDNTGGAGAAGKILTYNPRTGVATVLS